MSSPTDKTGCDRLEAAYLYALQALPPEERAAFEAHLAACPVCREEVEGLRPTVDAFVFWPVDVLRPAAPLWDRIAQRVGAENAAAAPTTDARRWEEPAWEEVSPGIFVKLLATDHERHRVSMLVRLAPGVAYPPHRHAGVEELHLLDGELVIDDRTLYPGDYNLGEPGGSDALVWSRTGCTCVLITSTQDELS